MFTPYIISKEHIEPHISELEERKKIKQQKKNKKCYEKQDTSATTASDLSAISAKSLFTPYIVSKEHTESRVDELEEKRAQKRKNKSSTKKRGAALGVTNVSSIPKQTRFAPYITSNRHVAASMKKSTEGKPQAEDRALA